MYASKVSPFFYESDAQMKSREVTGIIQFKLIKSFKCIEFEIMVNMTVNH